ELRSEQLYVFPNKWWHWVDERAIGPLGLSVEWFDLERDLGYLTYPNDPESPRKLKTTPRKRHFLFETQLLYLMETKWLKPVPLKTWTERIGFRKVDVVQTVVNRERFDLYFDRETHLPIRVVEHYPLPNESESKITYNLDDYIEVNGIRLPQTVTRVGPLGSEKMRVNHQINVDYDKRIFERPPTIEAGPEAWKAAKR
ncbi:MAG: hypothetical protein M3R15_21720, partial [Acidobacteriota bacterium]|nr:hypothetical protein [Acidobacteriota bacterium]